MRSKLQPLLILLAAFGVIAVLFLAQRRPEERAQPDTAPLVRAMRVAPGPVQLSVSANGTVTPRTESDLVAQVAGEIVYTSPALAAGGFFEAGQELARLDPADYRVDREAARAQVARAKSEYARAEKELARQSRLANQSVASESRIDDAENAYRVAEASLREAEARLERAARDLERTVLIAPYRGRVRSEQIDVGQFVNRGDRIARIYAVDYAEVRLPLPDRQLAFLDVPLVPHPELETPEEAPAGARVVLTAEFAGGTHRWEGRLVRTEAELDPRSRMIQLVARVSDPFGLETEKSAPLAIGLFVDAEIEGERLEDVYVLPRDALRPGSRLFIIDDEDRIQFRDVEVLRTERNEIIVGEGLAPGDRVCTSPLDAAIEGMQVRVLEDPPAANVAQREAEPTEVAAEAPATPETLADPPGAIETVQ